MWYDNDWSKRVKITVDNTKVGSALTDFPVYVDLSDLPADFHTYVNQTDARDIRVTESDGETEVAREIVFYDSGTDTGELHFKGDVSNSVDTDFYIYYNNSGASDYATDATYGAEAVWADYVAVYHLEEDPGGGSPQMLDSTGNGHSGVAQAGMDSGNSGAGKLAGNGMVFAGATNEFILISDHVDFDWGSAFTITAWSQTATLASDGTIFAKNGGGTSEPLLWFDDGVDDFTLGCVINSTFYNGSTGGSYTTRTADTWYYLSGRYDGVSLDMAINNVENYSNTSPSGAVTGTSADIGIGGQYDNARLLSGKVDEVRVSKTAFSDDRLATEYGNQNSSSTFYAVASAETQVVGDFSGLILGWMALGQDYPKYGTLYIKEFVDSIVSADTLSKVGTFARGLVDYITGTSAREHNITTTKTDTLVASDTITKKTFKTWVESIVSSEAFDTMIIHIRAFVDNIGVTEGFSKVGTFFRSFTDSINSSENVVTVKIYIRQFLDNIGLTDSVLKHTIQVFSDGIDMTESFWKVIATSFVDSISSSEGFSTSVQYVRAFVDSMTASEVVTKSVSIILLSPLVLTDTLWRRLNGMLIEWSKRLGKVVAWSKRSQQPAEDWSSRAENKKDWTSDSQDKKDYTKRPQKSGTWDKLSGKNDA